LNGWNRPKPDIRDQSSLTPLIHRVQKHPEVGQETLRFFDWCYREGGRFAEQLDYVTLPEALVKNIRQAWRRNMRGPHGERLWPPRS